MNSPQSLARYVSKGYSCSGKVASPLGATAAHADRRCYARHRAAVLALLCYSIIIQRFSPGDDRGVVWLIAHRAQAVSFAAAKGSAVRRCNNKNSNPAVPGSGMCCRLLAPPRRPSSQHGHLPSLAAGRPALLAKQR
jgi:hypothetical protein